MFAILNGSKNSIFTTKKWIFVSAMEEPEEFAQCKKPSDGKQTPPATLGERDVQPSTRPVKKEKTTLLLCLARKFTRTVDGNTAICNK